MKMTSGLTSCISLLILSASCSGYPKECFVNFYNSTEQARTMAKLVLEQCDQTDFSDPNGFATFLTRLVGLHNTLISERESHPPTGTEKPWITRRPEVHLTSSKPSSKPQPRVTSPSLAERSGSPRVPSGMPHREPGQTDSSADGESTRMDLKRWEPTQIPTGWNGSDSVAPTSRAPMWMFRPIKGINVTTFLMLIHSLMKEKEYRPRLMECLEKSRSPEIAWRAVQANLTRMGRVEASMLLTVVGRALLKAPVEELEKLPVPQDLALMQAVMNQFYIIHCNQSEEARTAVYHWLRKGLKSIMCPNRQTPQGGREERRKPDGGPQGRCDWLNEATLKIVHLYILNAPYRDLQLIPGTQMCRMLNNSQFETALSYMYNMKPPVGRHLFHVVSTSCLNITQPSHIQRLGALACFYDDVEPLDNSTSRTLMSLLRSCRNNEAQKNIRKLVKKFVKRGPLNKDLIESMGEAVSVLPNRQLASLSDQDVRDTIQVLVKVERIEAHQSRVLVKKFLKAGGKLNSSSDLLEMENLIGGVPSKQLREMGSDELLQAAQGGLEEHADKMSTFQKKTIVQTILQNEDSRVVFVSLSPSLRKELPTSCIEKANITDLDQVKDMEWNEGQALLLCEVLIKQDSIPAEELGKLDSMAQGVTCEMIERYGEQVALNLSRSLGNVTSWLSRTQFACVAKKLNSALDAYNPKDLQDNLESILDTIPSEILLHLSEAYVCQTFARACARYLEKMAQAPFELLPRSSPVRACVRDAAIRCLNKAVSDLNETDMPLLGRVVCDFTATNISQLPASTFASSVSHFGKCQHFHPSAPASLASKITGSLGNPSNWTIDMVTSLGLMLTFLDEGTIQKIPDTADVKALLLELAASNIPQGPAASPEFGSSFNLTVITTITFSRLVKPTAKRSRRTASCAVIPSYEQIHALGQANSQWTVEELSCMMTETFEDAVSTLGSVLTFSQQQRSALIDKAKEAWGPVSGFSQDQIADLKFLISALSVSELKSMDLSSLDNLDSVASCPSWTQEKRRAVLGSFLGLNGLTVAQLESVELSGLGNFLCGMDTSQISQLDYDAVKLASASLGRLTCPPETLGLLKVHVAKVFGPMSSWNEARLSELGTIAAGASVADLKSLQNAKMSHLSSSAIRLIPADKFKVLSIKQLRNLGPDNAAAVTEAQKEQLDAEQQAAVMEALGTSPRGLLPFAVARGPRLGVFTVALVVNMLLSMLLLSV